MNALTALFGLIRDWFGRPKVIVPGSAVVTRVKLKTSINGIQVLHHYESCRLVAYPDPGSRDGTPWTIGWGHTGHEVHKGLTWTREYADSVFYTDLTVREQGVASLLKVPVTQGQFDALVSFAFNVGLDIDDDTKAEGLGDSTLLRKVNAGDFGGAEREFFRWNINDGTIMLGLRRRRAAERALFVGLTGEQAIAVGKEIK